MSKRRSLVSPLRFGLIAGFVSMSALACSGGSDTGVGTGDGSVSDGQGATGDSSTVDTSLLPNWCQGQPASFSFFVTSMDALWALSESTPGDLNGGFGGNFGGMSGADEICQKIGAATGNGGKNWRAFLSATDDGNGNPVHAIDRIGVGPWSDANGRLVASGIPGLLSGFRPDGDAQAIADLVDECGVPTSTLGDAHDVVTASGERGKLFRPDGQISLEATCNDWTTSDGSVGSTGGVFAGPLKCGHSFPREGGGGGNGFGQKWLSDHSLRGCGKGANLLQNGPGEGTCIGCSGGYGALYCFVDDSASL